MKSVLKDILTYSVLQCPTSPPELLNLPGPPNPSIDLTGYWKATGPNKFIGGGTQDTDFCKGFSKGNFSKFWIFQNFEKIPLENPLQKSVCCVPPPMNLFGPVAFQ